MPSFKKVKKSQRVPHRERNQPQERKQLGILEKKKDYKIRSRRASIKNKTIKKLHEQALARNPDEFFFKMITQSKEKLEDDDDDDFDELDDDDNDKQMTMSSHEKLLMTQDANYVSYKMQIERKKVDKLEESIKLRTFAPKKKNTHIYFVEGDEMPKVHKRLKNSSDSTIVKNLKTELTKRRKRLNELQTIYEKLAVEKHLSSDRYERKKLVRKESKNHAAVYKWKPMRKK